MTPQEAEQRLFEIELPTISLPPKYHEILRLKGKGWENSDIAALLGYKPRWVDNLLSRSREDSIIKRLGVENRDQALLWQNQADVLRDEFDDFEKQRAEISKKKQAEDYEQVISLANKLCNTVDHWLKKDFLDYHLRRLVSFWFESLIEWLKAKPAHSSKTRSVGLLKVISDALDHVVKEILDRNQKYRFLKDKYQDPLELRRFLKDDILPDW